LNPLRTHFEGVTFLLLCRFLLHGVQHGVLRGFVCAMEVGKAVCGGVFEDSFVSACYLNFYLPAQGQKRAVNNGRVYVVM